MKLKKEVKILASLVLAALTLTLILFFAFFYKATLNIAVEPKEAKITVNGLPFSAGKISLRPGTYEIKVSQADYIDFEKTLKLKNGQVVNLDVELTSAPQARKIFDQKIKFLSQDPDGNLFFLAQDGAIYRGLQANKINFLPIAENNLQDVSEVIFSPNHNLAILKKGGETGLFDFKRYNLLDQEYRSFGRDIKGIVWQPGGEKIFYYFTPSSGEKSLIFAPNDNSSLERVADLRQFNFQNPKINHSLTEDRLILVENDIYLFQTVPRSLSKLTLSGKIKDAQFSPNGKYIIFQLSVPDPAGGEKFNLAIMDKDGKDQKELQVSAPLSQIAVFPDEQRAVVSDSSGLYQLNLQTLEKIPYTYKGDQELLKNAENLLISKSEKQLYFTVGGELYSLDLKIK